MNEEDRELLMAIYVQLSRILDTLYVLAGPENSQKLDAHHRAGGIFSSEPYYIVEAEDEEDAE